MGRTGQLAETRSRARSISTPTGVGVRVRALRVTAGLTQAELGGERFTKEYVSQVELGKTKPSDAALDWFSDRLGTTRVALEGESGSSARAATDAVVARAEAEIEAHRDSEALALLDGSAQAAARSNDARLQFRHAQARGWALQQLGHLPASLEALSDAGSLAEGLTDTDRAAVLYRVGFVRYKMGSLATSAATLDEALRLAEVATEPSDALRVRILNVRAKIRRRQKDFTAASEDVELALELARGLNDDRVLAETYLDASLVAERQNQYTLARDYAERSKALYERVNDHEYVGKLLNNLGQLRAIVGKPDEAVPLLREAFRIAVEQDNRVDAGFAASSLASARLRDGDYEGAVESGNRAIELLGPREEFREELGNARIVIGRAFMELDRIDEAERSFSAAANSFEAVETVSHLAGAWVALGDVAEKRGETAKAAELYRRAAEALQDVRW